MNRKNKLKSSNKKIELNKQVLEVHFEKLDRIAIYNKERQLNLHKPSKVLFRYKGVKNENRTRY